MFELIRQFKCNVTRSKTELYRIVHGRIYPFSRRIMPHLQTPFGMCSVLHATGRRSILVPEESASQKCAHGYVLR